MRRAEAEGTTVRAVGAGHAWSDVALTDGNSATTTLPDTKTVIEKRYLDGSLESVQGDATYPSDNAAVPH